MAIIFRVTPYMMLSSRYTRHLMSYIPVSTEFINRWNVAGAFFSPNGMRLYSKCPYGVENTVLHLSRSAIGNWWLPDAKSSVEKYLGLPSWSNISVIFGSGNESPIVRSLNFLKSITIRSFLFPDASFFFGTTSMSAFHWLVLGLIILFASILLICLLTSALCLSGNRYSRIFTGALSLFMLISCSTAGVYVSVSPFKKKMSAKSSHTSCNALCFFSFRCSMRSNPFNLSH